MVFVGPIQPGTSEEIFRETGETVPLFIGPIQPGTSEEVFRRTGSSVPSSQIIEQQAAAQRQAAVEEANKLAGWNFNWDWIWVVKIFSTTSFKFIKCKRRISTLLIMVIITTLNSNYRKRYNFESLCFRYCI